MSSSPVSDHWNIRSWLIYPVNSWLADPCTVVLQHVARYVRTSTYYDPIMHTQYTSTSFGKSAVYSFSSESHSVSLGDSPNSSQGIFVMAAIIWHCRTKTNVMGDVHLIRTLPINNIVRRKRVLLQGGYSNAWWCGNTRESPVIIAVNAHNISDRNFANNDNNKALIYSINNTTQHNTP